MALTTWKTFDFFEVSPVTLPSPDTANLFTSNEISSVSSGSDSLFLGTFSGHVHILGPSFRLQKSWQAHDAGSITHIRQIKGTSLLVTVAEDLSSEPVLKVWTLDKLHKKTGDPTCTSTMSIQNGRKPFPISALAVTEDLSQLAVGFANGAVTVVRGDLIYDRGARQRTVFESEEPVTGVEFRDVSKVTTLYVSTTARLLKLVISGKGQGQPARAVEDAGCGVGCMTTDKSNGDIVVVRDDAIYYYGIEGRGPCFAYDGPKSLAEVYGNYLAIVSPPLNSSQTKTSTLRKFGGTQADDLFNTGTLTLLDTELQIVAHQESLVSQVSSLFSLWGDLYSLRQDGKLYRYHEKSLQQRLEILYQRNLYVYAINLAQKAKLDVQSQNVIYRRYADHLYQKGDYDAAMQQYLKAIESTEPSQVIRKYLDTQRIHNLIEYLEELHEHHQATADHTTLLLNCYAKLKDIDKLERFIKSPGDLKFDLDTAISMCRQGGYFDQAAYLATKHGEHEIVVDILIEDSRKYREALDYIWRLDAESMYPNMMKYARVLLEHQPKETTQLFIDYYTDNYAPKPEVGTELTNGHTAPEQGYALSAANAVQNLTNLLPLPYMNTSALPTSTTAQAQTKPTVGDVTISADEPTVKPPSYVTPKPRTAFSSFVDHPDQFIAFLEVLIKANNLEEQDRTDLYTTLFEMYLHKASTCTSDDKKEEFQNKAKGLITARDTPLDPSNVLLLSHLSNFTTGSLLVKERAGLVEDIFRSYTAAKDTKGAIKALHKYGPQKPSLYSAALRYFTSDERVLQEAGDELAAVLQKIDNESLMAPLQVIQTLAASGVATIGLVKEYLQNTIDRERKEIEQNQRVIESYRSETESKRKEMDELASKPAVFQATRCSACGGGLELPAVHFLCKHSFHQRCLNPIREAGDDEDKWECPLCKGSNETIRAIRRMQDESADKHDLFKEELKRGGPGGGWRVVGEWFGRGVMKSQVAE